ncbi:MAG: ABC transporter permease, partial [Anaerolineae bacterium]|nr:ABC transporter permease [Anaerolineae bacterium]
AIWGGIAGVLKAYFDVNEILSTIMLNQIAIQLMVFLLNGILQEPSAEGLNRIPKSERIDAKAQLPRIEEVPFMDTLFGDTTRLHVGFLFAIVLAFLTYILLWQTILGYRIRAVGYNQDASRYAGINVKRQMLTSMLLAGGFAGLAGVIQVLGLQYRLQTDGSAVDFTGNAGFNGIVAALFGGLHPVGTIPASIFFGALLVGARNMQRVTEVPASLIISFNGIVVMFVVSVQIFNRHRARRRAAVQKEQTHV